MVTMSCGAVAVSRDASLTTVLLVVSTTNEPVPTAAIGISTQPAADVAEALRPTSAPREARCST